MASINKPATSSHLPKTHEGAIAKRITPEQELHRSVLSCLLWENQFYEDGMSIADRIVSLVPNVDPKKVADLAVVARNNFNLRHVPLLLARTLVKNNYNIKSLLPEIIKRPDELTEFLSLYWKDGKETLANSVMKGLAQSFTKFNEYQLAKYNRTGKSIKLKDVLFLCHAKPKDKEQDDLWKRLIDDKLETPDTWEVALSSGANKKDAWERLLTEKKLGGLALLRNLRNMEQVSVKRDLIIQAIAEMNTDRILPFRFIAAARHAPSFEPQLEARLLASFEGKPKIHKKALILVDVSGSMDADLSSKSDMKRLDAACGVAMCAREMFDQVRVFSFSERIVEVPARRGFALRDSIVNSQSHSSTYLGAAVQMLYKITEADMLLVFTDEQSHDSVPNPPVKLKSYMINVASSKNGVGYGAWEHVDGFSESIMTWIREKESNAE